MSTLVNTLLTKYGSEADRSMNEASSAKRKRKKTNEYYQGYGPYAGYDVDPNSLDPSLFDIPLPKEFHEKFAAAIFEIGLKNSSPKIIHALMPEFSRLNTEHIKSHLQKYRIRSKEEFLNFYHKHLKEQFEDFDTKRGWEKKAAKRLQNGDSGSSSSPPYDENGVIAPSSPEENWNDLSIKAVDDLQLAEQAYNDWASLLEGVQLENLRDRGGPSLPTNLNSLLIQKRDLFKGLQGAAAMVELSSQSQTHLSDDIYATLDPTCLGMFALEASRHDNSLEALNASNKILLGEKRHIKKKNPKHETNYAYLTFLFQ